MDPANYQRHGASQAPLVQEPSPEMVCPSFALSAAANSIVARRIAHKLSHLSRCSKNIPIGKCQGHFINFIIPRDRNDEAVQEKLLHFEGYSRGPLQLSVRPERLQVAMYNVAASE